MQEVISLSVLDESLHPAQTNIGPGNLIVRVLWVSQALSLWLFFVVVERRHALMRMFYKVRRLLVLIPWLFASGGQGWATIYVSNLDNVWTNGGVADIHGLFAGGVPYGTDTARFVTGSGSGFLINSVTLEFCTCGPLPPDQWSYVDIQLLQPNGNILLGGFGNPVVNPRPTQWPWATTFVDFSALSSIQLDPTTQYSLLLSVPASSPTDVALLFTKPAYTTPTDWRMRTTMSGDASAAGEALVLAIDATPVPEPSSAALLMLALASGGISHLVRRRNVNGKC